MRRKMRHTHTHKSRFSSKWVSICLNLCSWISWNMLWLEKKSISPIKSASRRHHIRRNSYSSFSLHITNHTYTHTQYKCILIEYKTYWSIKVKIFWFHGFEWHKHWIIFDGLSESERVAVDVCVFIAFYTLFSCVLRMTSQVIAYVEQKVSFWTWPTL